MAIHSTDLSLDQIKARIAEGITLESVVHVNATRGTMNGQNFCYTLGMGFFGKPDLIIFARYFDAEQLRAIVQSVEENWHHNGVRTGILDDILTMSTRDGKGGESIPVEVREVRKDKVYDEYMLYAKHAYSADQLKETRVCQILWPDDKGVLPTFLAYDDKRFPQLVLDPL